MVFVMNKNHLIQEHELEEITTDDGSRTVARRVDGMMYRSAYGAQRESTEVFVQGVQPIKAKNVWRIFELGFGTGMNFSNTHDFARKSGVHLFYEAVDHLPIPPSYAACTWAKKALQQAREKQERVIIDFSGGTLVLHPHPFLEVIVQQTFDAVYHDPFGPAANPESWTKECLAKEVQLMSDTGIWTSYGASGAMRRALADVGCYVAIGPGTGKKRETTRASKCLASLCSYKVKYKPN